MSRVDVIDDLVGITPGSRLDRIRTARPEARANAQASYEALFAPEDPGGVSLAERFAIATFVAGLHDRPRLREFYAAGTAENGGPGLADAVAAAIAAGRATGPYGAYPSGPLSGEDQAGPTFGVPPSRRGALGGRLTAALAHAHLLIFHPRDASPAALQALIDAGWTTTAIVTVSQLVAFLAFQIRVVEGLSVLGADDGETR